jgi:hypothetical protein
VTACRLELRLGLGLGEDLRKRVDALLPARVLKTLVDP